MGMRARIDMILASACEAAVAGDWGKVQPISQGGIDLDKAWHAIHFLVTGDPVLGFLRNGIQCPEVDSAEAFVEIHLPEDVSELSRSISELGLEQIINRYDSTEFKSQDIYPMIWSESDEFIKAYLKEYLVEFSDFVSLAMENNYGILVCIS